MKRAKRDIAACVALAATLFGSPAPQAHADAILHWNVRSEALITESKLGTPPAIRVMAFVQTAAYDAVIAVTQRHPAVALEPDAARYPSAHSILASAVAAILQAEIGDGPAPELATTSPTAKGVTRRWTSVGAFAKEVADARVYEGIHFRTSTEVGATMGRQIGELAAVKFLGQSAIAVDAPARTAAVR